MTPEEAAQRYESIEGLTEQVRRMDSAVARAREECERKRAEVVEAARETQKLELLWERHITRTRRAQERREQQTLDESAARRHQRLQDDASRRELPEQEPLLE